MQRHEEPPDTHLPQRFLVRIPHNNCKQGSYTTQDKMHVTACLAGQKEEVEVGEDCRSLQALREAIVVALQAS